MSKVITFSNHSPIRIADDEKTVWRAGWDFGWHDLESYTTKRGKVLYWMSHNGGTDKSRTTRTYLPTVAAIREYFAERDMLARYHADVEARVDPGSILDVDAIS